MKQASLTYIGGFVVQQIQKEIECELCCEVIGRKKCSSPLMDLIYKRDSSDKLHYPSERLVWILSTIFQFVCDAVGFLSTRICENLSTIILPALNESHLLMCGSSLESNHREKLSKLICKITIPIFLKNTASEITERFERVKYLNTKPASRKILRV